MSEREPSFLRREPGEALAAGFPSGSRAAFGQHGPSGEHGHPRSRDGAPTFLAAGYWRRLGGALIDLAVLTPIVLLLVWLASSVTGIRLPPARYRSVDFWLDLLLASDPALLGGLGLAIAIGAIYAMVFHLTFGRTPGMRVVGVRVIDLYGDPPTTGRALARTAGYLAGLATLGLGFVWIAFDAEKRGLHDYLAGTLVVRA